MRMCSKIYRILDLMKNGIYMKQKGGDDIQLFLH